ncbi:6-phosphogluconolactonase [Dokdonia sp. Hel_I_63]|uniref:6-phosphogluconolactonase n=1 Tax=Dokdonia sp. Hel_I_63 TaxID=1249996 RepID=UPI00119B4287|nr:6-phosphogluconolactonase [Dokdonia sp. Hel_I_63]TVZ22787.1 6-phosphogluconolactonase [Dokdonia sp. Hel_I_63]
MTLHISKTKQDVAQDFATYLMEAASGKDRFTVALSGGSTPKIVFDLLAEKHKDADWSKFQFYWGDERCVAPTDEQSNYKMTVDHLFSKINIPAENIHRILGENNPEAEAIRYAEVLESTLASENEVPQFDLVILGMGDDGHTASIFPHEIELWDSSNWCEVATHPESGQQRVSITGDIINNAQAVAFLVTGASKEEKVVTIINQEEDFRDYPASLVSPLSGELHWFMDEDAASGLDQ